MGNFIFEQDSLSLDKAWICACPLIEKMTAAETIFSQGLLDNFPLKS